MTIPDEMLMAYIDGELDPGARVEVEQALRTDPELAAQAAQYRDLRARLESAYAPELAEPVPERLLAVLRTPTRASVTDLDKVRVVREAASTARARPTSRGIAWRMTSLAAAVLLAVGAGFFIWRNSQSLMTQAADGTLVARGALARDLSNQLAGDSVPLPKVIIGLSFLAKSGDYCRTFSIARGAGGSGLACRRDGEWRIAVLSQPEAAAQGAGSQYRTAGSSLPPAVLSAVQANIAGEPLDRTAEVAARERGWHVKH